MPNKTLKDTVEGMLSNDWKERLVAEIEQVDIRLSGLETYLSSLDPNDPEYSILYSQQVHMVDYLTDLMARANCHEIEYKLPRTYSEREAEAEGIPADTDPRDLLGLLLFLDLYGGADND